MIGVEVRRRVGAIRVEPAARVVLQGAQRAQLVGAHEPTQAIRRDGRLEAIVGLLGLIDETAADEPLAILPDDGDLCIDGQALIEGAAHEAQHHLDVIVADRRVVGTKLGREDGAHDVLKLVLGNVHRHRRAHREGGRVALLAEDLHRAIGDLDRQHTRHRVVSVEAKLRADVEGFAHGLLVSGADDLTDAREVAALGDVEEFVDSCFRAVCGSDRSHGADRGESKRCAYGQAQDTRTDRGHRLLQVSGGVDRTLAIRVTRWFLG